MPSTGNGAKIGGIGVAADDDDLGQPVGIVEAELHRDLAAHRVADDVRLVDAERRHEAVEDAGVVLEPRLGQHDLVALAVLRHVVKHDAELFRKRRRR